MIHDLAALGLAWYPYRSRRLAKAVAHDLHPRLLGSGEVYDFVKASRAEESSIELRWVRCAACASTGRQNLSEGARRIMQFRAMTDTRRREVTPVGVPHTCGR
eukprot:1990193-Rhodomonas_salina.2